MTDNTRTDDKPGLGAQLWGAVKGALVDEDPVGASSFQVFAGAP